MSVFCRVSFKTPSVKFRTKTPEKEEASQNPGAIFPRTVYPGMSLSLLPKQRIFTSLGVWFGKLLLRYFDKRVIR